MTPTNDDACRCCGAALDEDGRCEPCRDHGQERQEQAAPRDRQMRHPGRDR